MIGEFEYLLITAAARIGDEAYGGGDSRRDRDGDRAKAFYWRALYDDLIDWRSKGLLKDVDGRGRRRNVVGRAKRMVRLTPNGVKAARRISMTRSARVRAGRGRRCGRRTGRRAARGAGHDKACMVTSQALLRDCWSAKSEKPCWAISFEVGGGAWARAAGCARIGLPAAGGALAQLAALAGGIRAGASGQFPSDGNIAFGEQRLSTLRMVAAELSVL